MRNKIAGVFIVSVGLLVLSAPLFAHHGTASFSEKVQTMKGTVSEWIWSNPHCFLKFDVKDESGNAAHWAAETQNPTTMRGLGWERTSFKAGDTVTVTLQGVKSGAPIGRLITVTLADGTVFHATGAVPAEPPSTK